MTDARKNVKASPGHGIPACEPGRRSRSLNDIEHAIQELREASEEMKLIPTDLGLHDRNRRLIDPLARLDLVRRFCEGVLGRYVRKVPRVGR